MTRSPRSPTLPSKGRIVLSRSSATPRSCWSIQASVQKYALVSHRFSIIADLCHSCSPPAALPTQAKKNHSQVLTTCQRCDVALRTRSMSVCLSPLSWTSPLSAPSDWPCPQLLSAASLWLNSILRGVAHIYPQHVPPFRHQLALAQAQHGSLHSPVLHQHPRNTLQAPALIAFAPNHVNRSLLHHRPHQLVLAWSTLPVLTMLLVAYAPVVAPHQ